MRMEFSITEIEAKEGRTVGELLSELQLPMSAVLIEVNGEVFYLDEIRERRVNRGDMLRAIPLIAGG